jgi:spore coat protein A
MRSLRHMGYSVVLLALFAVGCSDDDVLPDSGSDASVDLLWDKGVDAPPPDSSADAAPDASNRLDPTTITKFKDPLVIPPVMPHETKTTAVTDYEIAAKQFDQQVLPTGLPKTTVWGYGRAKDPLPGSGKASTYNFPAFTIAARSNEKVRVKWINGLVDSKGAYLPHLLPVDQTLHWANPAGPIDSRGTAVTPYKGPVPFVTHVHGAHVASTSDGYPEAWFLPNANNIPSGYKTKGTNYGTVSATDPGAAIFEYTNDQRASTIWYHDHAMGITRLNVYAGLAGFWILRDAEEDALNLPGPAPKAGDAAGASYYEIPIAIQDRSFNKDGSLFYPDNRAFFDGFKGPYVPKTKVSPIWNPEFFGDTIVVNGKTWPYLNVERRLYRMRLLNGCNSRFLILKFNKSGIEFNQIGSEGGLLPGAPVKLTQLVMAPAERADVIVDFSKFNEGDEVILINVGPDEPYKGPNPSKAQTPADPKTTGQVMKFKVVKATTNGNSGVIPTTLPAITPLTTTLPPRDLTLNEEAYEPDDVPQSALLGTGDKGPLSWGAAITETPKKGDTEIWRVLNLTEDSHPIHLHLVMFQVLDRIPFDADKYHDAQEDFLTKGGTKPDVTKFYTGSPKAPASWEKGWKDTVIANPGEVTRIIAKFDLAGLYVWHCHILEHEDNEMMRPFKVLP